ncbi:putative reverse transcriptase domain-containing protein, partial [Tanacetum coccineum]
HEYVVSSLIDMVYRGNGLLVRQVLDTAYASRIIRADKMYHDFRDMYWWLGMKKDIATYMLQKALGTRLDMSRTYYPQINGQSEHTIQTLEDMLRALNAARDLQKSYADNRQKPLEFSVGDHVLLKVSPWKGVVRFGKKGKLAPRYVRPFEIVERIGLVAFQLRLPQELSSVYDTFHVLNLKKCLADANLHVPLEEIKVYKSLRFIEIPVEIMNREVKRLKRSRIPIVKVRWNSKQGLEFTWEREEHMKAKYPHLFSNQATDISVAKIGLGGRLIHA